MRGGTSTLRCVRADETLSHLDSFELVRTNRVPLYGIAFRNFRLVFSVAAQRVKGALGGVRSQFRHGLKSALTGCGPPFISVVKISAPAVSG
jgi:hypothetical protein